MGLYLTKDGIKPQEVHTNTIIQFAVPQDVKNCGELIPNFATIAEPLTKLLRKTQPWIWTQDQQESFERLKSLIAEPTVLAYPDCSKPFVLYTDASDVGKKQEHKFRIIRYLSRTLAPAERNYSSPERECLAIMTDCKALLTLKENANFVSRLMRWHLALQQFTFGIKHVKRKENLGDILSRIDFSDLERSPSNVPWNLILMVVDQDSFQLP